MAGAKPNARAGRRSATLHGLFEEQVDRDPGAVAVVQESRRLTYAQLDARADELAAALRRFGVGPAALVAIALDRSPDLIAAMLAVLKTGAAYLPIDTSYPDERIAYMAEDSRPVCLLTDAATATRLPAAPQLLVETVEQPTTERIPLRTEVLGAEAAYVVYTSGSTGRPKGVVISHSSVTNYLTWMREEFEYRSGDRMLQKTPAGFDGAVLEIFGPLVAGAALVLARPGGHREPEYLAELIEREGITIAQFMPSMLPVFLEGQFAQRCKSLRLAFSASEALPLSVMRRFHEQLNAELINLYGPTEATVDAAFWRCRPQPGVTGVPIGRPVRNMRLEVLDAGMRRLPDGEVGEIYLAGVQLARGYLDRPGLTAERFVADPYGAPGDRAYRTGDLGRMRPDGLLEFAGRADGQVKIGGVRVEPAEIEAALVDHPAVMQAAVVPVAGPSATLRLVAYVVPWEREAVTPETVRDSLREALPEAMVPAAVRFVDALPTTPNEKIDRAALAALEAGSDDSGRQRGWLPGDAAAAPEEVLLGLVREVLGAEHATGQDNFIGLGGDSISAIQLASRARQCGLRISTAEVLRNRTLGELARGAGKARAAAAPAGDGAGAFPPTPIMHWLRELGGQTDGFSQSMVLRTPAGLTEPDLLTCLQAVIDRHDMLRAWFPSRSHHEGWAPQCLPRGAVSAAGRLEIADATDVADRDLHTVIRAGVERARTRLRIGAPELLSAVWFRRDGTRQGRLAVVVQHLAIDGMSLRILQADLELAWQQLRRTGVPRLGSVPVPFHRWAGLLEQDASSPRRRAELARWTEMADGDVTRMARRPLDRRRDTVATAGTYRLDLAPRHTDALLNRAPAAFGVDVNTVLVTGLLLALAAWRDPGARQLGGDFRVAFEGHGREEILPGLDLSQTVGWFTSLFPARLRLDPVGPPRPGDGGAGIRQAMARIGSQLAAIPDKGIGYGQLRYLNPDTSPQLAACTDPELLFNYLGRFEQADGSDWAFDPGHDVAMDLFDATTPLAFAVEVNSFAISREHGPVLTAEWRWGEAASDRSDVRQLADGWFGMLTKLAEETERTAASSMPPDGHRDIADSDFSTF